LHLKTVQTRHLHVKDDAVDRSGRYRFDEINELLARGKRIRVHPQRTHETLDGAANGFIVIHDGNKWFGLTQNQRSPCNIGIESVMLLSDCARERI
jgi:hypothetical protein